MTRGVWPIWLVVLLALAGCQAPKITPNPTALAFYRAVHDGDGAKTRALAAPELLSPQFEGQLAAVRAYMPREAPRAIRGVGFNLTKTVGSGETLATTDEYAFVGRTTLVNTSLRRASAKEPWFVQGFHLQTATEAQLAANKFDPLHKPFGQLAFLIAVIASPLLMIAALIKVIRRKGLRRKWLWGILAFVGLFSFKMNWSTGAIGAQWITIQLIGAGAFKGFSAFEAWILTMTLPLGAVLILTGVWGNPARGKAAPAKAEDAF